MRQLLVAFALLAARPAWACSAFLLAAPAGPVVAKGYDWSDERGLVVVNKRGVEKRALVLAPADLPATWRSRYASLTFNQYGRELPNGGMNEAGLVVEVLMLPASTFPAPDGRPVVTELGLVQYLLDQAATTAEAVDLARKVRVASAHARVHYFVCDAESSCAALELLGRELVVAAGAGMPARAMTNSPYGDSARAFGKGRVPSGQGSLARFVRLAVRVASPAVTGSPVEEALGILDAVRFADSTQWQIAYEPKRRRVHFRSRSRPATKFVSLDAFPPDCSGPVMVLDVTTRASGDVAGAFVPYTDEANVALVRATTARLRPRLPRELGRRALAFATGLACQAAFPRTRDASR
jgi:choloylglycine hydrolase